MKRIISSSFVVGVAACTNMLHPDMNSSAIPVTGKTSRFVGDTLVLAYFDRRRDSLAGNAARLAIGATIRAAFPSAVLCSQQSAARAAR